MPNCIFWIAMGSTPICIYHLNCVILRVYSPFKHRNICFSCLRQNTEHWLEFWNVKTKRVFFFLSVADKSWCPYWTKTKTQHRERLWFVCVCMCGASESREIKGVTEQIRTIVKTGCTLKHSFLHIHTAAIFQRSASDLLFILLQKKNKNKNQTNKSGRNRLSLPISVCARTSGCGGACSGLEIVKF